MLFSRRQFLRGDPLGEYLMQVPDRKITKVGIVPYYVKGGTRHYLIASPHPSRDKGAFLPFTLARGTRKGWLKQDGKVFFDDLDRDKWQTEGVNPKDKFHIQELEPLPEAALREGREELAVYYPDVEKRGRIYSGDNQPAAHYALKSLLDCGNIRYKEYPIRFFAGELAQEPPESYHTEASAEVRLVTLKKAAQMVVDGTFKPDYFERLQAIDSFIEEKGKGRRR